jgi:hypothetical protein
MANQTTTADFSHLAHQQALLAASLSNQSAPPEGFDQSRITLAANLLLSKRRRSAASAWPDLAKALGNDFTPLFTPYARSHPMTPGTTPRHDALRFAQHLADSNQLPEPGLRLLALAQSRYFLPTRRGPFISLRLPFLGAIIFRVLRVPVALPTEK